LVIVHKQTNSNPSFHMRDRTTLPFWEAYEFGEQQAIVKIG
jgi:hypothetical protein